VAGNGNEQHQELLAHVLHDTSYNRTQVVKKKRQWDDNTLSP
jgi:hypothetical protein